MVRSAKSYCRICSGQCGMVLTIDDADRIVAIRGDKDHPLSRGYACIKGLQAPEAHHGKGRLLHPLRRNADGKFEEIGLEQALDEIAARLGSILDRDGPEALATFRGTMNAYNPVAGQMIRDWLRSLGSRSFYSTMTIDQSAKWVTFGRLGGWGAGKHTIESSDVWLLFGTNPLVSLAAPGLINNPALTLKEAKARGMKLIIIDPRRTETARQADLFLQPRPGEDVSIAAGLLNIILTEGWEDTDFCERYVEGLHELRTAVAPFTVDYVAGRAGISVEDLRATAALFAGPGKRGIAHGATGIAMAARSNLSDHLIECLNVVCGRFMRAGETISNPGATQPPAQTYAEVIAPQRPWEQGPKSRTGGRGMMFGEKMTGELADEILMPGAGRVRALFVDGGNPVSAIPDQKKVVDAFRSLELLVTIDPYMTTTARLSHYVLPPRVFYEHADLAASPNESIFFSRPMAAYTPAIIGTPPGSEVVEDWYVFWAIAKRLGRTIRFHGVDLDMEVVPTKDDLHAIMVRNARVNFDTIRSQAGRLLDLPAEVVQAARTDAVARFAVAPPDIISELEDVVMEATAPDERFRFRLTARRLREVSNTMYKEFPAIRERHPYNAAYLHPDDLTELGLVEGDRARIVSDHGEISAIVDVDESVRRGVVSMSHGWGGLPDDPISDQVGVSTSLLISTDRNLEVINAMPRMSSIPVFIEKDVVNPNRDTRVRRRHVSR